jgi:serine/threonine-protein kinase
VTTGEPDRAAPPRRHRRKVPEPAPPQQPAGDPGTVRITVSPWAFVSVDGKDQGTTPLTLTLAPGDHEIVIRNPELDRREVIERTVEPGARTAIRRAW